MTAPARVLMTTDAIGGVWRYSIDLARELGNAGVRVDLAVIGPRPDSSSLKDATGIPNLRLHFGDFPLEWMNCDWPSVDRSGRWLLELEQATAPDVVHLNGYIHGDLPWRAPALVVGHSSICSWFEAVEGRPPSAEWSTYRARVRRGLRAATAVTAPTRAMLSVLERLYAPFAAVEPIANGCYPTAFAVGAKRPIVFTAGRLWDRAKNVAALAETAASLEWPVYAAGPDVAPDGARIRLEPLRWLGRLSSHETAEWMNRALIFASPARYEPFGLAILEAAAAGCALVLGDIPSLRENWRDCALFVEPEDVVGLRRALRKLMADAPRRTELAERARRRARSFTPRRTAQRYFSLYERMLAESLAPAVAQAIPRSSWSPAAK